MAHHAVIHVSQRARRAGRKDIYIILIITNVIGETNERVIRAKEPTITPDKHSGTHEEWGQKSILPD